MDNPPTTQPYTTAIFLSTFSLLAALLITPPMIWHFTNRNIGATSLILWPLLLNLQSFLNALLWSHDNTSQWFDGNVLCDIEVKIMIASLVGVPSSVASVLRALARVMNTEKASLGLSKSQKRRGYAVDLAWCWGFPALQMFFHYLVQIERYYVMGIAGCVPAADDSWVTDLLILTPPVVWTLVGGYYSGEFLTLSFFHVLVESFGWLT
jgi:pheromone a factor receptor